MYKVEECFEYLKELFFPTQPIYKELQFTQKAYAKLMCYINLIGDYEITGFGRVVDNQVVDVKILKQEVKSATVDCDVDAMNEFLMAIPAEQTGQWVLDWHSHVDMAASPSGTDKNNYEEQWEARLKNQFPYLIINKKQQYYARCYINKGRETEIKISLAQEGLTQEELQELYAECKADIEKYCTKFEYVTYTNNYYGWNNKKKEEEKEVIRSTDVDDYCFSCGHYLRNSDEYDRHLCNRCWNKMSASEQRQWMYAVVEEEDCYYKA